MNAAPLFGVEQRGTSSDDYYTPRWVFDRMSIRFDLDVAAPPGGVPWVPTDHHFTLAEDGLAQSWRGRVWMNPPFSKPSPWVRKFIAHGNDGYFDFVGTSARSGSIFIPVWFAAFGAECVDAISRLGVVRTVRRAT